VIIFGEDPWLFLEAERSPHCIDSGKKTHKSVRIISRRTEIYLHNASLKEMG
jgi:hypothetical protein